ncbi:MAG: hypothetical protein IKJ91_11765 [Clostridia bacterium]|nr:hypothetical protein [Clostridia bacterium]MBR3967736.1 hypothetical protein [Clostridia bacterium]
MRRVKKRIYSGVVCEQIVYSVSDRIKNIGKSSPRVRFKTEEERAAHRRGIARRRFARLLNENFTTNGIYSTLTFNRENEIHSNEEAKWVRKCFYRRLKYFYPDAKIVIVYGRGKNTHRFHLHMVSEGIPAEDIKRIWFYGKLEEWSYLREHNFYDDGKGGKIDHGKDFTALAYYLFDHYTPEQGGHYYMSSRNLKMPDSEDVTEVKQNYTEDKPPKRPKGYILVSKKRTEFGFLHYKYVRITKENLYYQMKQLGDKHPEYIKMKKEFEQETAKHHNSP